MPVLLTRRESHPSKVSVKERIHMYSDHVKQKGGTPPAPEPTMFVQKGRRSTMPIIEPLPQKTHRPERGKSAPFPLRILPATLSDSHLLSAQPTRTGNPPRRQSFHCIEDDDDDIEAGIALSSLREWRKKQASFHVPTHETANGHECSQPQLTVTVGDDRGLSVSDIGIGFDNDNDSAEQVRDWVLTNGNGNSHPVRSNTHSRVRLCRSSDTTMYSGEAEEVNKLRGDNSFLLAENRQLKQRLLLLERSLPVEIDELPTPLYRRKKSKAHTQDLMIEVGHMERVLNYTQVYKKFLLSEGRYLNKLLVLSEYFAVPFKLLVAYKPNVLSFNNYQSLFLNCEELVRFHKMFHSAISAIKMAEEQTLVSSFLSALEINLPYITVYGPFLASKQPMRRKLFSELMKNREFAEIVGYQEQTTETSLKELLEIPYTRLQNYIELLQLTKTLPMKIEQVQRGFTRIIQFLDTQTESLREEPGEWAEMKKKLINFLEKLAPDSLIPVEVFDPKTVLKKFGQLETKTNGKVVSKECFLFSRHFSLATIEHQPDRLEYKLDPPGLISLCGARVFSKVDVEGQAVQEDFDTGLEIDHEAFLVALPHGRGSYLLKAHKPLNWVQQFLDSIEEAKNCTCNAHTSDKDLYFTANFGGNLAAASVDKLIALLINPQCAFQNYLEVFFTTYPAFTSPKALLDSLVASAVSYTADGEKRESVIHPVFPHHLPNKHRNSSHFWESDQSEKEETLSPELVSTLSNKKSTLRSRQLFKKRISQESSFDDAEVFATNRRDSDETLTPMDTPRVSEVLIQPPPLDPVVEESIEFASLSEDNEDNSPHHGGPAIKPRKLVRKLSISVPDLLNCTLEGDPKDVGGSGVSEDESPDNSSDSVNGSNSELEFSDSIADSHPESTSRYMLSPIFRQFSSPSPTPKEFRPITPTTRKEGMASPGMLTLPTNSPMHSSVSNPEGLSSDSKIKDQVSQQKVKTQDYSKGKKKRESTDHLPLTPQLGRKVKKEKKIVKVWNKIKRRSHASKKTSESDGVSRPGSISSSLTFDDEGQEMVQAMIRVLQVIEYWIKHYPQDFSANPSLREFVQQFLSDLEEEYRFFSSHELFVAALQLIQVLQATPEEVDDSIPMVLHRVTGQEMPYLKLLFGSDKGIVSVPSSLDLLAWKPAEVAQQLTIFQFAIFTGINRCELLNTSWKSKKKEKLAPNVLRAISEGNRIMSWVATEVLSRETELERAGMVEFFIQVAHECFRHHDLHSLTMVHSALSSYTVQRLKGTWTHVGQKYRERLHALKPFCDPSGRSKKMREHIKNKKPPCLPYLGAYLDQIWSLEQSKATKSSQDLINFSKMKSLHEIITSILKYQKKPYRFHPQFKVLRYIYSAKSLSEEELYELSKTYEAH